MPEEPIPSYTIKDVWAHNVEEEFRAIRKLILKYPFVAMVRRPSRHGTSLLHLLLIGHRISGYCRSTSGRI